MRLALELGQPDVDGMLDGMSEEQLLEWMEYFAAQHAPDVAPAPEGRRGDPADGLIAARLKTLAGEARQRALSHAQR